MNDIKNLFNNKKGQADFIGNFLSVIPKPLLFLFFILLLTVIPLLLSPVFQSFGVFCQSDGTVLKLPESNIVTNIRLMATMPDAREIAGESLSPNRALYKCTEYVNDSFRLLDYGCSNCTHLDGYFSEVDFNARVCSGDAFRTDSANLNWWKRSVACPLDDCRIPKNYFYSVSTGSFECLGDCSSQVLAVSRDSKLFELGAYPYYAHDDDDNTFSGFFRFGCSESLRVEPTIKGIAVFRFEFWAILILIVLLGWAIMKFAKK